MPEITADKEIVIMDKDIDDYQKFGKCNAMNIGKKELNLKWTGMTIYMDEENNIITYERNELKDGEWIPTGEKKTVEYTIEGV